jgi:choline dehydrogenase
VSASAPDRNVFDYVIVGAGSAGCVLARRLSEDPDVQVLLIEAGGSDAVDLIEIPACHGSLFRTDKDWDYGSGYEPHCNGRRMYLPRGRVLGGSSSINLMVYIRGNWRDYDEWRDLGCDGWGWPDMLACFKRAEDNERGASEFHGSGGPLRVSDGRSRNPIAQAFVDAALAHGLPYREDFNELEQDGTGWYQVTQRDGQRASSASSYLHPVADRANLHVRTHVQVLKVLFDGNRAAGVQGVRAGELIEVRAEREVILSAGAYGSPQLLMLSGVGPAEELASFQIKTVAAIPGVGLNLQDHPTVGTAYLSDRQDSLFGAMTTENLHRFRADGQGPLTSSGLESAAFVRTIEGLEAPDVQLSCAPALLAEEGLVPPAAHGFTIIATVNKPSSRGQLTLASADPTAKPRIMNNLYEAEDDLRSQTAGVRLAMQLAQTMPLANWVRAPFIAPATESDNDIIAHVRARAHAAYHPVGTCKMGIDDLAVVDPQLRVHGVEALRVVDASIMPTVPRGNTNAPTIAVAERAAELILGTASA